MPEAKTAELKLPAVPAEVQTAPTPPEKSATENRKISTIHGDMHDLLTGLNYTVAPTEILKHSAWIDSQVEAGKMVYVD